MSGQAIFHCVGYLALSLSRNGILYPVFHHGKINWPFVQEIDENGRISSFIDFFETDMFVFVPSAENWSAIEGDYGRFAYYDANDSFREISYDEVGLSITAGEIALNDERLPLLTRLALARVGGAQEATLLDLHQKYLRFCNLPDGSVATLTKSDARARRSQHFWWEQIKLDEFGDGYVAEGFRDSPTEDIFEWLFDQPVDEKWKKVFLVLARRVMFDDRIFDLLTKFLGEVQNFADFSHIDKFIVGRLVELYGNYSSEQSDVADILYDELVSGHIFYLCDIVKPEAMIQFIQKVSLVKDKEGDLGQIIDSIIDYLTSSTAHSSIFMPLF